jgi:predicted acylesterase/phospholipase RssA
MLTQPTFPKEEASVSATADSRPSGKLSREDQRKRDVAQAESVLRGGDLPPKETYDLADRLKNNNEFGYARKLFGRIRARNDYTGLTKNPVKVGQRHALCTYKDPDLPAVDRFQRALEILEEVDRLQMSTAERQESLGLKGAVHKRWWQVAGQRADLERSLGYYMSGYELGPETDQGYTGINAAFVLDLLAREDATQAASTGARWMVADEEWQRARAIRLRLTEVLPGLVETPDNEWLRKEWWYYTTLAEAWLGLGEFDKALAALRGFNREFKLGHEGPPLDVLPPWEFESTITQLAALAGLQADLAELLSGRPNWSRRWASPPAEIRRQAEQMLTAYLGTLASAASRALTGKVGLALSGGGFRASLFHLGVLAYLAERDVLRRVEVLSCVSGGSIVGAHFYLEVKRLLEQKPETDITTEDYLLLVERLERDFLAGIQTNIRSRVFSGFWSNLRAFIQPSYTTTRRLATLCEVELYSRVQDGRGHAPRYLKDLFIHPAGEGPEFKPKYDNWRRSVKVPVLVLNATTLNTGHNWQFTASWMGEPPSSLDAEIEGNYRLRRMYHWEAPRLRDKWRSRLLRPFAPPDYQQLRLGEAVAASSSVPGLFEPLVLPDLYDGKTVRLVDGGVYDNQGVASLLEQDCTVMLVSDASGQMAALDHPGGSRLEVPLRSFSVSMARVRQAQFQELSARARSGLLKGLAFLHLKKDLDADPVDWRECQDPYEASDEARPAARRGVETRYHIPKAVQRLLAGIRTDLDSFTEVEAFSLMTSGYRMAETEFARLDAFADLPQEHRTWRFLQIEPALRPGPGYDELTRQLLTARLVFGKVWLLARPLMVIAGALGLALLFGVWRLWLANQGLVLVTVRGLGIFILVLLATVLVPTLVRLVRYRETLRNLGLQAVLAALLAIGLKIHLLLFDPLFLRLGRASRFIARRVKTP